MLVSPPIPTSFKDSVTGVFIRYHRAGDTLTLVRHMADEMKEILDGEPAEETAPASEEQKPEVDEAQKAKNEELEKKEEQLKNLNAAITEAQAQLKAARKEKASVKVETEEEIPRIDFNDPSAKAWGKHMDDKVSPMQAELDKEKEEIRTFALRKFITEHPSLSKNQEKLREVVSTYERIRTASERTQEGVLLDLDKAYAAVHHEELMTAARRSRVEEAEANSIAADIAVSRGSTSYQMPREATPKLSADDRAILAKWGMTPEEWGAAKKKYG